jgi:hypothetical protein
VAEVTLTIVQVTVVGSEPTEVCVILCARFVLVVVIGVVVPGGVASVLPGGELIVVGGQCAEVSVVLSA